MKTIKKHIGLWATMAALLTGACTTYPDDFGFSADLAETQVEYNAFRPTGYDITVKTPIANFDEGAGITQVGYTVNGEERHCEPAYSEADGCYCLTISLQDLQFSQVYNIQPFIGDDTYQNRGNTKAVGLQKSTLKPIYMKSEWSINDNREVICKAYYSCSAVGYPPVENATATFGDKEIKAIVSEDGQVVTINLGDICKLNVGNYSGVKYTVTNAFGSDKRSRDYKATINDIEGCFPDDGDKNNCIRICGIDWAKGLFYFNQTTKEYAIEENQWSYPDDLKNPRYGGRAYFYVPHNQSVEKEIGNELKGNKEYDIVTKYIEGWGTPSYYDFKLLVENTSIQPCNVIDEAGNSIYGHLFLFPSDTGKRFTSSSTFITVSYKDVNKLGLFLPCLGVLFYYSSDNTRNHYSNTDRLYYLTSTVVYYNESYTPQYNRIAYSYVFSGNYTNHIIFALRDGIYDDLCSNRYNIRPVKL